MVTVGEAADISGVADHRAGDDGPDAEELGERGLRCPDSRADASVRLFDLLIEAAHVIDELEGELVAHVLDRGRRLEALEQPIGVRCVEFLGNSPGERSARAWWSRQISRARIRPRSWLRLDRSRMITLWSAVSTRRSP